MTLLAVERIKLFSTRSPWWCVGMAMVITIGMAALISANTDDRFPLSVSVSQGFTNFGMVVLMVMAALAVVGGRRAPRDPRWWLAVPVGPVLVTTLLFYGAHRIRAPAEPTVVVLAAIALASWHTRPDVEPAEPADRGPDADD